MASDAPFGTRLLAVLTRAAAVLALLNENSGRLKLPFSWLAAACQAKPYNALLVHLWLIPLLQLLQPCAPNFQAGHHTKQLLLEPRPRQPMKSPLMMWPRHSAASLAGLLPGQVGCDQTFCCNLLDAGRKKAEPYP